MNLGERTRRRTSAVERIAARSARHPKAAVAGWFGLVAAAFVTGQLLGTQSLPQYDPGQAGLGEQVLHRLNVTTPPQENVLIQPARTGGQPAYLRERPAGLMTPRRQEGTGRLSLTWAVKFGLLRLILGSMAACGNSGREGSRAGAPGSSGLPPGFRAGKVELTYRLDGPRPGGVYVRAGTELVITLEETRGYAWTAVESLHPTVVQVLRSGRGPKVTAVARAVAAGDAELRWTSSFTGDPYGPPTLLWRLKVTVAS